MVSSCVVVAAGVRAVVVAAAAAVDATTLSRLCREARLPVLDMPPPPLPQPVNRISSCDMRMPVADAALSRCWRCCNVRAFCAFWKLHRSSEVGVVAAESSAYGRSRFSRQGSTSGRRVPPDRAPAPPAPAAVVDCGVRRQVNWLLLRYSEYGDAGRLALDCQHTT